MGMLARSCAALCLMGGMLAGSALAQDVYKWTDANGTVHYGQLPPAQGASKVKLSGGNAVEPATPISRQDDADKPDLEQVNAAQLAHLCQTAKKNLELLDSQAMLVGRGDINSATQVSEEQRASVRAEAQAKIKEFCHG